MAGLPYIPVRKSKRDEKAAKGNKHAANTKRRDRKRSRYLFNLRERMNPKSKQYRSEKDAKKAARLFLGNKHTA